MGDARAAFENGGELMPALPPPFTLRKASDGTWFLYWKGNKFGRAATREEIWMWHALKRNAKALAEARETRD